MRSRRVLLASAGVVLALALGLVTAFATNASARAGPWTVAGNTASFTDPAGDATGGAPDITGVTVTSDDSGNVTFAITTSGFTAMTVIDLYLDTDRSSATGSSSGCEYNLEAVKLTDSGLWAAGAWRWDGSKWTQAPRPASLAFVPSGGNVTFTINKTDLGASTGFSFWVDTVKIDSSGNVLGEDQAPNGSGLWGFDFAAPAPPPPTTTTPPPTKAPVATPAVKPMIGTPVTLPARPIAGKRFTVSFPVARSDSGAPLTSGTMICDPSVNGKVIAHAESFTNGTAKLSFTVPKSAKGKQLKVKVTIKSGGQSATKIATFRVS